MEPKSLVPLALVLFGAFGCASSARPPAAQAQFPASPVAAEPKTATTSAGLHRPALQPVAALQHGGEELWIEDRAVSLTGDDKPYAQRFDPSGWSGSSTPPNAIGGGPRALDDDNPYEDEGATDDTSSGQTGENATP